MLFARYAGGMALDTSAVETVAQGTSASDGCALHSDDLYRLFADIVDIESVSRNEKRLADEIEALLKPSAHLEVLRQGNTVVARTHLGRAQRVVIAGHLDTVPLADNLPSRLETRTDGDYLVGRGTADMKGGIAVMAHLAAELAAPKRDITWIFYECEEIEAQANGLAHCAQDHPDWIAGDFAVLMEPTSARIEGGCQGTMRFTVTTHGVAAHSARSWLGRNAIHDIGEVLNKVRDFPVRQVFVEGLEYREGLNATIISGGVAGNVIPDRAQVQINYRFAPDLTAQTAESQMRELFDVAGVDFEVLDLSPAARPGLDRPDAQEFIAAVSGEPGPKYGWTDVARFSELGIPAVNFGPADAGKAHADDECCPLTDLDKTANALRRWLS